MTRLATISWRTFREKSCSVFQPGWADWEAGPVLALLREYLETAVQIATPDGQSVLSIGGITASADLRFSEVKPDAADVFLVIGSYAWPEFHDPSFFQLLSDAAANKAIIGAICAGTVAAARANLFDDRVHTSNGQEWLLSHSPGYAGHSLYRDTPSAVSNGRVVSAPGTAPYTFASEIAGLIDPAQSDDLKTYLAQCGREFASSL